MGCSRSRRAAYSLLELTFTLAILAVVSAIAAPRYWTSLDHYQANAAARRIVADLGYAHRRALAASAVRTVVFDPALDRYTIVEETDPDHGSGAHTVDLRLEPYRATVDEVSIDDPLDDSDDVLTVIFDAYGNPDSGGTISIHAGTASRTVVLDEVGRAVVQ